MRVQNKQHKNNVHLSILDLWNKIQSCVLDAIAKGVKALVYFSIWVGVVYLNINGAHNKVLRLLEGNDSAAA